MKTEHPIRSLCEALEVSASGYYDWSKRQTQPSPRAQENAIVGTTTLTPAYAVNSWYLRSVLSTPEPFGNNNVTQKVTRDLLGNYSYYTKIVITPAMPKPYPKPIENNNPFPVTSINKLNMTCSSSNINNLGTIELSTTTTVQTETEVVWLDTVVRTGLWPDNGPWTVWLKAGGSKTGCGGPPPSQNNYYWAPATVSLGGGYVTVSVGTPNCILNYPFFLAEDFYK